MFINATLSESHLNARKAKPRTNKSSNQQKTMARDLLKYRSPENTVTGGVAMINHALADLWTGQENMHPYAWIGIWPCWQLPLKALPSISIRPTELYRQHSSNVLGARTLENGSKLGPPSYLFAKY